MSLPGLPCGGVGHPPIVPSSSPAGDATGAADVAAVRGRAGPTPDAGVLSGLPADTATDDAAAFAAPPDPQAFAALVDSVVQASPAELPGIAHRLGAALRIADRLAAASDAQLHRTLDLLRQDSPQRIEAHALLGQLRAAGERPETFGLSAACLRRWRARLWKAVGAEAAARPELLAWLVPHVRSLIRRSPLLLELRGRPDVLAAILRYAYGGDDCEHGPGYEALCTSLRSTLAGKALISRCLKDELQAALTDDPLCPLHDRAATIAALHAAKAGLDAGRIGYPEFRDRMETLFDGLVRAHPAPVPGTAGAPDPGQRRELAGFGLSGIAALAPPGVLTGSEPHIDGSALFLANLVARLCRDRGDRHGSTEQALASHLRRTLDRTTNDWNTTWGGGDAASVDRALRSLRRAAWLQPLVANAAIRGADLPEEEREAALRTVARVREEWLVEGLRRDWAPVLCRDTALDVAWYPALAGIWCDRLRDWRADPAARADLLDPQAGLLSPSMVSILQSVIRPGTSGDRDRTALCRRDLLLMFDRCLCVSAIEEPARGRLTAALQARFDRAMRATTPERGTGSEA